MMRVLVLNGGTSTVKAALATVDGGRITIDRHETVALTDESTAEEAFQAVIERLADGLADVSAIGHRVVHGGDVLTTPVLIDGEIEATIGRLVPLAPLHNPVALAGIRAARARVPARPMVAVFETAFHADRALLGGGDPQGERCLGENK